jgi:hypothetical protein
MFTLIITDELERRYQATADSREQLHEIIDYWTKNLDQTPIYEILIQPSTH